MESKDILNKFKRVGSWIADETLKRSYPKEDIVGLSKDLQYIKNYLENKVGEEDHERDKDIKFKLKEF